MRDMHNTYEWWSHKKKSCVPLRFENEFYTFLVISFLAMKCPTNNLLNCLNFMIDWDRSESYQDRATPLKIARNAWHLTASNAPYRSMLLSKAATWSIEFVVPLNFSLGTLRVGGTIFTWIFNDKALLSVFRSGSWSIQTLFNSCNSLIVFSKFLFVLGSTWLVTNHFLLDRVDDGLLASSYLSIVKYPDFQDCVDSSFVSRS